MVILRFWDVVDRHELRIVEEWVKLVGKWWKGAVEINKLSPSKSTPWNLDKGFCIGIIEGTVEISGVN